MFIELTDSNLDFSIENYYDEDCNNNIKIL